MPCGKYINVKGYKVKPHQRCVDKKNKKKSVSKNIAIFGKASSKASSGPVNMLAARRKPKSKDVKILEDAVKILEADRIFSRMKRPQKLSKGSLTEATRKRRAAIAKLEEAEFEAALKERAARVKSGRFKQGAFARRVRAADLKRRGKIDRSHLRKAKKSLGKPRKRKKSKK